VTVVRRIVLFLLLLTVPFQAAVGSTGFVCGHGIADEASDAVAASAHAVHSLTQAHARTHRHTGLDAGATRGPAAPDGTHSHGMHSSDADGSVPQIAAADTAGDTHNEAGSCSLCSECSFSAAPASEVSRDLGLRASPLRILVYVDPGVRPHVGDDLFRPPRISRS
jgi:hypothetical protein